MSKLPTHSKQKEDLPNEKWLDFYDGYYSVSNYGRVYSNERTIVDSRGYERTVGGRLLTIYKDVNQNTVRVSVDGNRENLSVPILVASMFIRDTKEGEEVMHVNKNKWDDRLENLKIVSHHESKVRNFEMNVYSDPDSKVRMMRERLKESGNNKFINGKNHINANLTEKDVKEIREKYKPWEYPETKLAKEYGVSRGCINGILLRNNWKHVK